MPCTHQEDEPIRDPSPQNCPSRGIIRQLIAEILASGDIPPPYHSPRLVQREAVSSMPVSVGTEGKRPQDKTHFNHTCSEVTSCPECLLQTQKTVLLPRQKGLRIYKPHPFSQTRCSRDSSKGSCSYSAAQGITIAICQAGEPPPSSSFR